MNEASVKSAPPGEANLESEAVDGHEAPEVEQARCANDLPVVGLARGSETESQTTLDVSANGEALSELPVLSISSSAIELVPLSAGADSTNPSYEARLGDVIGEKYRLSSVLGKGGMGCVYAAEHLLLGKRVALKLMHVRFARDDEYLRRFRREARAASSVDHVNVVRILDYGIHREQPFLVMELIDGEALNTWFARQSVLPIASVVSVMSQILCALEVMHGAGIVHRDLKPANVVVGQSSFGDLRIKVLDLGLAHFNDGSDDGPTLTQHDWVAGTPDYMSPEQTRSLRVGPSSDLYAAGCILTELLQGSPPFQGEAPMDVMSQHLFAPAPHLNRAKSAEPVPLGLEKLRLELLAKHPSRRPASASEARQRLLAAVDPTSLGAAMSQRRSSVPPAARADRIPRWNPQLGRSETPGAPEAVPLVPLEVIRLGEWSGGIDLSCRTGLCSLGFEIKFTSGDLASLQGARTSSAIYVIDVGAARDAGLELVRRLVRDAHDADIVVCALELGANQVSVWIEAGASDTLAYPITADGLGRRLTRLVQRRARMQRRSTHIE